MADARADSAPAGVPPFAVMKDGLKLEDNVRSRVLEYEPLVTPSGKPAKLGVVVATPAFWKKGAVVGAWMWEAVVPDGAPDAFVVTRPLKLTCSDRVWAALS